MDTHSGGDIVVVEESSPVSPAAPQGGQVVLDLTIPPSTKSGAPLKSSSYGRSIVRSASSVVKQVPRGLQRLASFHRRRGGGGVGPRAAFDRSTTAAAHALNGLRFINRDDKWGAVEERFKTLTENQDGVLYRSQFGQCIGMNKMEEQKKDVDDKTKDDQKGKRDGEGRGSCCFFGSRQEMGPGRVVNHDENKHSSAAVAAPKKPEKPDFAGELFDALKRRRNIHGDGGITKEEMLEFWDQISDTSFDGRLQTFFDMVDKNADGRISEEEIKEIITLSASENKLSIIRDKAEEYARLIMEDLDPDNLGHVELHKLESLLVQQEEAPIFGTTTSRRNLSKMRSQKPDAPPPKPKNPLRRARHILEANWQRLWVILLWLSACAALFAWKFAQYRRRRDAFEVFGYCVCAAKGAAETLKLNMALVLLPVSRNALTFLRAHLPAAAAFVPLADNLNFHMVIAAGIAVGAGVHVISHLACDFPRLLHATDAQYQPLGKYFGFSRPDSYWWFVKGTEGWTGLTMVALMSVAFTLALPAFRRGMIRLRLPWPVKKRVPGFEAFWYSHHCFVAVYALLLVHGQFLYLTREWYKKTTWMYLAAPMVVYAGERLTRAVRSRVRAVEVMEAEVYPGNVLSLRFSVGKSDFRYKSGQYVFVNCAAVSRFQWHPFSITSAPQDDYVSVHIRDAGDWTRQLVKIFSEANKRQGGHQIPTENGDRDSAMTTNPRWPKLRIDGPYGAPAQDYKQYDVVLLVGMGIGATPMISIIKDIVNNLKHLHGGDIEAGMRSASAAMSSSSSFRTRRAYFYWVTREQRTFEWFHKVMEEVVAADRDRVIELHNHCTNVYEEGDARSALISMIQSIKQAKTGVDIVSETRVRTHFARPNWNQVYKRIADNHNDQRVGVFYCGPPVLTKELSQQAQDFSRSSSTKFEFHKEIF
ncbi:unnamed protein product [Urochloa decumbens]|uniref:Uncharacterized protein n=1 Tax=Urochloa decumbens TaxID=240449 RepID=A0ABC9B4V3_9POAL